MKCPYETESHECQYRNPKGHCEYEGREWGCVIARHYEINQEMIRIATKELEELDVRKNLSE